MIAEELDEWATDFLRFCAGFVDVFDRKAPPPAGQVSRSHSTIAVSSGRFTHLCVPAAGRVAVTSVVPQSARKREFPLFL